jgi:ABC-type nickel/cobalt efflux system permease component RcnA
MTDSGPLSSLIAILKDLYTALSSALRAAQGTDPGMALALLIGLSFAYGVLHVVLPGHQKAVIGAYFLSENSRYGQGFLAGALFAVFHALSATLLPFILRVVFQLTFGQTNQLSSKLTQSIAVAGILLVALILFILKLKDIPELRRRAQLGRMRRRMGFDLHDRLETAYEPIPWRKLLPFLFFAAILPCPDTIVFLAALSRGAVGPGLASVGAMTLGMALTLTAIALSVIAAKRTGRGRLARRSGGWIGVFSVEVAGLVVLVAFAFLLIPLAGNTLLG